MRGEYVMFKKTRALALSISLLTPCVIYAQTAGTPKATGYPVNARVSCVENVSCNLSWVVNIALLTSTTVGVQLVVFGINDEQGRSVTGWSQDFSFEDSYAAFKPLAKAMKVTIMTVRINGLKHGVYGVTISTEHKGLPEAVQDKDEVRKWFGDKPGVGSSHLLGRSFAEVRIQ